MYKIIHIAEKNLDEDPEVQCFFDLETKVELSDSATIIDLIHAVVKVALRGGRKDLSERAIVKSAQLVCKRLAYELESDYDCDEDYCDFGRYNDDGIIVNRGDE